MRANPGVQARAARGRAAHALPRLKSRLGLPLKSASWLMLLIGMLGSQLALADVVPPAGGAARPRIGLVFGGGGAKGAAHIGVLQVLDELHVPVDCVVGASMGALVGGTFAAGIPAADIRRRVLGIDWAHTVGGQGLRDRAPIHRKLADLTYSYPLEIGLSGRKVMMPGGLVQTQNIEDTLRGLVSSARVTEDFDDLPIPFRAVATDMVEGSMAILGSGDLALAMRASMATPGVFAPIQMNGRVLSDGGLVRNLPVDVARDLCADVVIAVWMSSPPPEPRDLTSSALSVVKRSEEVMVGANEKASIASLTAADVGIEVPMGDIGPQDFTRVPEAVELGRTAAEASRAALMRLAVSEGEYRAWRERVSGAATEEHTLAEVQIVAVSRVNPDYVRGLLQTAVPGATVSEADIATDAQRVYAVGDFERVDYRVTGPSDASTLEVRPVEKSWGPNFVRFDLGLATTGDSDLLAAVRLDHDRTWITSRGGHWHNALQIGRQTLLASDFYQPLDIRQRFFVQPLAHLENTLEDLYIDGDRVARLEVRQLFAQADLGVNVGSRAQLRLGLRRGWEQAKIDTGLLGLPELDREIDTNLQLRAIYDTRDSAGLPTRGSFMNIRYVRARDWLGGELDYKLLEGVFEKAFNVRGNSLALLAGAGDAFDTDLPITETIELGGIRTFPGLRPGELRGTEYWFVGASYAWRVFDFQPLFGQALYAGVRLQAGEMVQPFAGSDFGTVHGISGSLSGRTPLGPFELSLGHVDVNGGTWRVQFSLGRPLAEGSLLDELR